MNKLHALPLIFASFSSLASAAAPKCTLGFDAASTHVKWTAFKTTDKTPVGGAFDKVTVVTTKPEGKNVEALLKGASFTIDTASVNSGNPARDATLKMAFFGKFQGPTIQGTVKSAKAGKMDVVITMNGVSKPVAFDYALGADGQFSAKGKMDVMDFGLKAAHDALHEACKGLHAGKDGVSKTWTEVDLEVVSTPKKNCK